VPDGDNKNCN